MGNYQIVAAILTVALCATKPRMTSRKKSVDQWRAVWNDYKKFWKQLERADQSIDKRGINPD